MQRVEIIAKGEVQRIGHRDVVLNPNTAKKLNLKGFAENLKHSDMKFFHTLKQHYLFITPPS